MVLVDPVHEFRLYTRYNRKTVPIVSLSAHEYRTVQPTSEVTIPKRRAQTGDPFSRLPEAEYKARILLDQRTIDSYPPTVSAEIVRDHAEAERATFSELYAARQKRPLALGSLPIVMLTRGQDTDKDRQTAYAELAASLSTRTRHTEVPDAGHEIHLYRPIAVVDAIREVIALARAR
jgi:pimeloyl-ACP methyl ester carboxylesterase